MGISFASLPTLTFFFSEFAKQWKTEDGVWMVHWMRYQVFAPLVLLQLLNLFWYYLMCKIFIRSVDILNHQSLLSILCRAIKTHEADDDRSDDEADDSKDD